MRLFQIVLIAAAAAAAFGADSSAIQKAEREWAAAVKGRDFAALERIFTPALIYAHATGAIETRQKYIDRLRGGKQRYDNIIFEKTQIEMYGDAAVSHSIMRMIGVNDGGKFNDHVMMMHLWVKQNGAWRLAAHQTTKIP